MTTPAERPPSFLERRPLRRALRRALSNWLERHQHPFNRGIHLIGIPLALVVAPILLLVVPWSAWLWPASVFVAGYMLQWIGHRVEGNDLGEWAGIKRMLGLPYVGVSPRWNAPTPPAESEAPPPFSGGSQTRR
jgi:hypothetical protein